MIRTSWATLTNEIESIGVLTFLHMFEKHPNLRNNFKSFKHLTHQELKTSEIFHNHAARVVNVVKKVTAREEVFSLLMSQIVLLVLTATDGAARIFPTTLCRGAFINRERDDMSLS